MNKMRRALAVSLGFALAVLAGGADFPTDKNLSFDREIINRYSLDHLPRSLSIRQGEDYWIGYDLERAKVYKAWQSPAGKPGLSPRGFNTRSVGVTLYEDKSEETWHLRRRGREIPLRIRYLGVSQRGTGTETRFLLKWELRHEGGRLELEEEVSTAAPAQAAPTRLLRVTSLGEGELLIPPAPVAGTWKIVGQRGGDTLEKAIISGDQWHRVSLSPRAITPRP